MKNKQNKKILGFTMIELLIVIVILGILSVIGLGSFQAAQMKSRDSKRKSSLNSMVTALEVYYNDFGNYPGDTGGDINGCGAGATSQCSPGSSWENTTNGTLYMLQMPEDPSVNEYFYQSDGTYFRLFARLENTQDKDVPLFSGSPGVYQGATSECGGEGCNYVVTSTNIDVPSVLAD